MSRESTRRRFVGAVGVSAIGLTAGCADRSADDETTGDSADGDGTNAGDTGDDTDDANADEQPGANEGAEVPTIDGGAVVFVYDDGPIEDYEEAFPVHREFDAPATTGIVSEWIGREDYQGTDWMAVEHLEELAAAGWEIASHTTAHTALGAFELVEDAGPEDTRIYPEARNHGFHHGYEIEVTDGDASVRRTVVDSDTDETGGYLEFDDSLGESFEAGETVERYPEDVMHEFLGESKRDLEDIGFEAETLLAPYDVVDGWTIEVAREYYDGIANVNPGSMYNDPNGFEPFDTHRDYFIEFTTPDAVAADLDRVAEEEALGVIGAHTFKEEVTADRIRQTLEWVADRDLEVVTFRDAIRATG